MLHDSSKPHLITANFELCIRLNRRTWDWQATLQPEEGEGLEFDSPLELARYLSNLGTSALPTPVLHKGRGLK